VPFLVRGDEVETGPFQVLPDPFASIANASLALLPVLAATLGIGVRKRLRSPWAYCLVGVGLVLGGMLLLFAPRFVSTTSFAQPWSELIAAIKGVGPFIAAVTLSSALLGRVGAR
jgi:hypothetical protein